MSEASRVWRFQLDETFVRKVPALAEITFSNRWLSIVNGVIAVKEDYAWDGCSPSWFLPVFGWVGVPNGAKGADGYPKAYYPSLVHDALCQFRAQLPITKTQAVDLLREMLIEYGFANWQARLYAYMVYHFGPQNWPGLSGYLQAPYPPSLWTINGETKPPV